MAHRQARGAYKWSIIVDSIMKIARIVGMVGGVAYVIDLVTGGKVYQAMNPKAGK